MSPAYQRWRSWEPCLDLSLSDNVGLSVVAQKLVHVHEHSYLATSAFEAENEASTFNTWSSPPPEVKSLIGRRETCSVFTRNQSNDVTVSHSPSGQARHDVTCFDWTSGVQLRQRRLLASKTIYATKQRDVDISWCTNKNFRATRWVYVSCSQSILSDQNFLPKWYGSAHGFYSDRICFTQTGFSILFLNPDYFLIYGCSPRLC